MLHTQQCGQIPSFQFQYTPYYFKYFNCQFDTADTFYLIIHILIILSVNMQSSGEYLQTQYYYFFVNTISGKGEGKKYLTIKKHSFVSQHLNLKSQIFFFDLISNTDRQAGFQAVKQQSQITDIHVIICGGDGTVLWVLSEIRDHQLVISRITFSIIPIGSGNDFSRTLGWGYKSPSFSSIDLSGLSNLIQKWQQSETVEYDIWDVEIESYENGKILKVGDDRNFEGISTLKTSFSSYFGIGIDGRIAYTSEKNRGKNVCINRLIYSIVGCLCFFNPAPSISNLLTRLRIQEEEQKLQDISLTGTKDDFTNQSFTEEMEGSIRKSSCFLKYEESSMKLKSHWHSLVCINGGSYMAGVKNIWCPDSKKQQKQQKFDDGKLQIVAFRNQLSLALERLVNLEENVCQSSGPFQITFKEQNKPVKTYVQLDGEPMVLINPRKIVVKHSSISEHGKIRVLSNKQPS